MFDLLDAYANAIFPMADPDTGVVHWYSPDPRGILPLDSFHVPKNLARLIRQGKFNIRSDTAFEQVMRLCAQSRSEENGSWMVEPLLQQYLSLHEQGHAHSVEAWLNNRLVGGLYGVHIGGAFFGESMFSLPELGGSNASKVCLVYLVQHLRKQGFTLLDTQFVNDHLVQFGCIEVPHHTYAAMLQAAISKDAMWQNFDPCTGDR